MRVGTRAKLIDEPGVVTIVKVISIVFVEIEDENGFVRKVRSENLITIADDDASSMENLLKSGSIKGNPKKDATKKKPSPKPKSSSRKIEGELYIDIHDHALPERYHHMLELSKFERAMRYFEDQLWEAQKAKLFIFRVNHGLGEGVLRNAVRKRLSEHGYSFHDESFDNPGTTVVHLRDSL